ncbi:MAG: F0F1 ATP synthase subunit delta [Sideroxydans sp.]|jgi:F-type H+-transporting ATPase subunit delta
MSEAITIARPYAQAAFEEAQKLDALKGWSEMLQSLAEVAEHPEMRAVMTNPSIPKQQIEGLMDALLGAEAGAKQKNFVRILAEKQRLLVLPEIAALFEDLKADAEKTVNVVVDSAFELTAAQQDKIVSSLKKRLAREIKLTSNIKKDLLGGVVIRAGDKVIDGSALTRLAEMANALA